MNICENCYWFDKEKLVRPVDGEKIYPCNNIGSIGWKIWAKKQEKPYVCDGFVKRGEYKPTGAWAQMQGLINEVDEHIKEI